MTPQHPAAPETEPHANGLTEAERETLAKVEFTTWAGQGERYDIEWADHLLPAVERIVAERVRVVEGERDLYLHHIDLGTEQLTEAAARAESAEAAHEAEKAAHERLRAGIWALGESIHGDEGVEHVEGCEGEPTCFACILDTLRSLLGGGEAR